MTVGFLADDPDFYLTLMEEAHVHGLTDVVRRGLRLAQRLYGTPLRSYRTPMTVEFEPEWADHFYIRRFLARDDWGRMTRPQLDQVFYIRSPWQIGRAACRERECQSAWKSVVA